MEITCKLLHAKPEDDGFSTQSFIMMSRHLEAKHNYLPAAANHLALTWAIETTSPGAVGASEPGRDDLRLSLLSFKDPQGTNISGPRRPQEEHEPARFVNAANFTLAESTGKLERIAFEASYWLASCGRCSWKALRFTHDEAKAALEKHQKASHAA